MADLKKYQEELSKCSKCGFCEAFCPVYAVTGRETEVARGRNVQLMAVLKGDLSISEIEEALSTCLLCRACAPSCFSGVKTDELVRAAREELVKSRGGSLLKEIFFNNILPYPGFMAALAKIASFLGKVDVFGIGEKIGVPQFESHPHLNPLPGGEETHFPPLQGEGTGGDGVSEQRPSAAYFRSCGFTYLLPDVREATIKAVQRIGYDVVVADNNCCGLPPYAHGYTDAAKNLARKNIEALEKYDVILTECGSCSSFLKKYADLLSDDSRYSARAKMISERVKDSNEFLYKNLNLGQPQGAAPTPHSSLLTSRSLKVTYHDPCHLGRYQGITKEPREIIKSIPGIEYVELPEADWCCGGAGSYSLENKEISMKILERKMNNVKKTGADLLATSCPACMIQLSYGVKQAGLDVKVVHVNQLLADL